VYGFAGYLGVISAGMFLNWIISILNEMSAQYAYGQVVAVSQISIIPTPVIIGAALIAGALFAGYPIFKGYVKAFKAARVASEYSAMADAVIMLTKK
jgi:hypothetical protein